MDKIALDIFNAFTFKGVKDTNKRRKGETIGNYVYSSLYINVVGEFEPIELYSRKSFFKNDFPMQWGQAFYKYGYTFLLVEGIIYVIKDGFIELKYEI